MSVTNQVVGGAFQDTAGNVLVDGYLILQLSQDSTVNTNTMICSGYEIKIPLNSSGSVASSPAYYVWTNDLISPSTTFYTIYAYSANGQLVWGPNYCYILSTPSPFDLGAIVP